MTTYCANHPDVETGLRCNRCNKYICARCAVRTPTGYRCRECIREQKKVFDTAKPQDFIVGSLVGGVLAYLASLVANMVFGFFVLLIAPVAGMLIANIVLKVIGGRRSNALFITITTAVALGSSVIVLEMLALLIYGGFFNIIGAIWPGLFAFLVTSTFYTRISGIQIR